MKPKTIVLIDFRKFKYESVDFRIDTITNSVEYKAGENLSELDAMRLCRIDGWTVKIRQPKDSEFA